MKKFILAILLGGCALNSAAEEIPLVPQKIQDIDQIKSIFGIQLGSEINKDEIPDCNPILVFKGKTCFTSRYTPRIILSKDEAPDWIRDNAIVVTTIDKKVEQLLIPTAGFKVQQVVLSALIKKYGQPHKYETIDSSNAFGRTINSPMAFWSFGDIEVTFIGVVEKIDQGAVAVNTKKYRDNNHQINSQKSNKQRPL